VLRLGGSQMEKCRLFFSKTSELIKVGVGQDLWAVVGASNVRPVVERVLGIRKMLVE